MIGGALCFLSYMATWSYLEQFELGTGFDQVPTFLLIFNGPTFLLIFNGLAVVIYYTLDCVETL